MYQEQQESLETLRAKSPLKIAEIVFAEGFEPLTTGPCRLLASLPWEQLREPAFPGGRLSFFDFYIAKLFEISIYEFRNQAVYGLQWSFFVESTTKVEGGQKSQGIYRISRQLVNQVEQDFGLTTPELTAINYWERGIVEVNVPTLDIYSDGKIDNWKKFVSTLSRGLLSSELISSELIFQHPIDQELEDCIAEHPDTNGEFQCLVKAYGQWDEELNRIYKALKLKLDSLGQEALEASQLKWIEYRDKEFDLVNNIYPQDGAGRMSRNFNAARRAMIVKARVLELGHYLESRSSTSVEEIFRIGNA